MTAGEILIPEEQIRRRVETLCQEISAAVPSGDLHVIITLKGALFFAVDLVRALGREVTIGFITASSYGSGTKSSGEVHLRQEDIGEIAGRHVLIVDDIIDTGRTLLAVTEALRPHRPASIRTAVLIDKPARREAAIGVDYVGFTIGDIFVVGYGLDSGEEHRTLPDIRAFIPGHADTSLPAAGRGEDERI